jgi:hypothetical protein
MRSSTMFDGPSIDDYWRRFVVQAKVAHNDAAARGKSVAVVEPPLEVSDPLLTMQVRSIP